MSWLSRTPALPAAAECESFLALAQLLVGLVLPTFVIVRYLPTVATARLRRLHAAGASKRVLYYTELGVFRLFGGQRDWGLVPGAEAGPGDGAAGCLVVVWWGLLSAAWLLTMATVDQGFLSPPT